MESIIVLFASYKPNTAPGNRLIAFLRGFDEQGQTAHVYFLWPDEKRSKITESFQNITLHYMWSERGPSNRYLRFMGGLCNFRRFLKLLTPGDSVFVMGSSLFIPGLVKHKDVKVYQERTEHPEIVKESPAFIQKNYLASCPKMAGMFAISTKLKETYEELGAKNVHIVNVVVDSSRFAGLKKTTDEKYIAYCGTASNNKDGVDDLIRAFAIVAKTHPEVKLKIMGKSPSKDDESGNLQLVEHLGVKDKVVFTGVIPASDMPQMLKNATIVALARPDSLQAQCGFPTKLGEYLLSENPVVVTSVGDIPLFLKDKETALLSQERNPKEFATNLLWALEHPQEADAIGRRGAEVALKEFNYLTESKKIIDVITRDRQ